MHSVMSDQAAEIARLQAERAAQRGISLTSASSYDGDALPENKFAGYLKSIPAADMDEEMEDAAPMRYVSFFAREMSREVLICCSALTAVD